MPADLPVYRLDRIFIGIIGGLQGNDRVEEQSQRLGRFHAGVHVTADSDLKPAAIPINIRPPFRFEAGHDSNQKPAVFRL